MRCSLSSLAITGISIAQIALASPLTPQKPINSFYGPSDHHTSLPGNCEPLEESYGPEVRPDNVGTFQAYKPFTELAKNVTTPEGYKLAEVNMQAGIASADLLRMVANIEAYDPNICAQACDDSEGCKSFNIFILRCPTLAPSENECPDPPSQTEFECLLFTEPPPSPLKKKDLIYSKMWADFEQVAAGSNLYNKIENPKRSAPDCQKCRTDPKKPVSTPTTNKPAPQPKKPVPDPKIHCNGAPVVRNGGFEMDDPSMRQTPTGWTITDVKPSVGFGFTKPGSSNNGGTYGFLANLLSPDYSIAQPLMGFTLSTVMNTCPGTKYNASLEYRFDNAAEHRCAISFGHGDGNSSSQASKKVAESSLVVTSVSDDVEGNRPHVWLPLKYTFTAKTDADLLAVHVQCNGSAWNNYSVDNVEVVEVKG